jgi:hypothetical protein
MIDGRAAQKLIHLLEVLTQTASYKGRLDIKIPGSV